jgi:hypothetical protein
MPYREEIEEFFKRWVIGREWITIKETITSYLSIRISLLGGIFFLSKMLM